MKQAGYGRQSAFGVSTEMVVASVVFILLAIVAVDITLAHRGDPGVYLLTEPEPPRLIPVD